jgi:hypothetical protein
MTLTPMKLKLQRLILDKTTSSDQKVSIFWKTAGLPLSCIR